MNSLHDPLPPALSVNASNGIGKTVQEEAQRLTLLKESITARLDSYFSILQSNSATMQTTLIDPEGFPRSDIDVASIRTARVEIIRSRNDLKAVMDSMASLLERGLPKSDVAPMEIELELAPAVGFAKVNSVAKDSPAESAGLKKDDVIISIGSINSTNHDSLKAVGALVGNSEDIALPIVVTRNCLTTHLRLTPKAWSGRGLLGCHIVLI